MFIINNEYILSLLERLCNTCSPSGYTGEATALLRSELEKLGMAVSHTKKGSLYAYLEGRNRPVKKALAAHVDTLGAMVKEIKSDGHIVFTNIGGVTGNSVECENCRVHTASGKTYTGTIYSIKPSAHIFKDTAAFERSLENMELILDEKVRSKSDVLALGIEIGDFISFESRFRITESGFIKSRHLDDKAGTAIIVGVCKYLVENDIKPENTVQILITNYEEVGHGACCGFSAEAEELLCIDMGAPGTGQNTDEYSVSICAKDSSGPYDYGLRSRLARLAEQNKIAYKLDIYPYYSSDASAALRSGLDIRSALIGPGVYASHSYERTHIDSIDSTAKLLLAYLTE